MPGETIDSLTVDIGLSSAEFEAGVNRILASMGEMRTTAAQTGDAMGMSLAELGSSIGGLAMRFAGLFLAFRGIEDVVGYFKELHGELAKLNVVSEYFGSSASELSRLGEVAKLAGGNSQDAIDTLKSLQSSIFGLEFQGQMGNNLLMLQRLGVAYLDASGNMRDMKDIAFDAAKKLHELLPGPENQQRRVQYALQFASGGIANAIGGPLSDFRAMYAKAVSEQKNITDKAAEQQRRLQQDLIKLSYVIENEAVKALNKLTPQIEHLIGSIETSLIPTIDELIGDVMEWLHPKSIADKMASGAGVGPLGLMHPINTFEAIGIGLGIRAAQFHEWWEKQLGAYRTSKLSDIAGQISIPAQVQSRLAPGTNLEVLKLIHLQAGGDTGDPTWSKAIGAYQGVNPQAYLQSAATSGHLPMRSLSTPGAARPGKPTASLGGPRVNIGTVNVNAPQATDANGIAASMDRALQRKLLVSQSDPGLA